MKRPLLLAAALLTATTLASCNNANPVSPAADARPAYNGVGLGSGGITDAEPDATAADTDGGHTVGSGNADDVPADSTSRSGVTFGSGN